MPSRISSSASPPSRLSFLASEAAAARPRALPSTKVKTVVAVAATAAELGISGIGLLPGDADEYVVTSGGLKGRRGFFTGDESGAVVGVDLAGRLFRRA